MASDLRLKLKLTQPIEELTQRRQNSSTPLLIGARGGTALKELLSTAPNPEVAISDFQNDYGIKLPSKDISDTSAASQTDVLPAIQLLDLLNVPRSKVYNHILDKLLNELLLRIDDMSQEQLQSLLTATFPYIEFRELRAIPIAVLSKQEDTPDVFLRELTENRKIMLELPIHVRRRIMLVDSQEFQQFVDNCTQKYIIAHIQWYLSPSFHSTGKASSTSGATNWFGFNTTRSPEERRRTDSGLQELAEIIGDSEKLYLSAISIFKHYIIKATTPGCTYTNPKEYVDYVPFIGALRCDLTNIQRDKATSLMRTDPLHKFMWFIDRATKTLPNQDCLSQVQDLLTFIKKFREGDLPVSVATKKKEGDGESNFEIVMGPPPIKELMDLLEKIQKVDKLLIFADPVPDDVPNYKELIKEPMAIATMKKKAQRGKYKSIDMVADDFNLMIQNCLTFNPENTIYYKEAKRVGKRGNELLEKNASSLRGEPQRIRAKKRKTSSTASNATGTVNMLGSSGIATLKDYGDVEQSGMALEGVWDEALADFALVLTDPEVKIKLCLCLWKQLGNCWMTKELPTDHLGCRGLIQLLQIGNPASIRRMLRKQEYIVRAPQVVTMRVFLPLLLRLMAVFRIGISLPGRREEVQVTESLRSTLLDPTLWQHILRASAAIRVVTKAFILQSFSDNQIDIASTLLKFIYIAEEDTLLRDRTFLHHLIVGVGRHMKDLLSSGETSNGVSRIKTSCVWQFIFDDFFMTTIADKTQVIMKDKSESCLEYFNSADDAQQVRSFPLQQMHENVALLLVAMLDATQKVDGNEAEVFVSVEARKSLNLLKRLCISITEFQSLWESKVFEYCRNQYDYILHHCTQLKKELFSMDLKDTAIENLDEGTTVNNESNCEVKVDGNVENINEQVETKSEL